MVTICHALYWARGLSVGRDTHFTEELHPPPTRVPSTQQLLRESLWKEGGHGLSLGVSCQDTEKPLRSLAVTPQVRGHTAQANHSNTDAHESKEGLPLR